MKRVLLIDDDATFRLHLARALMRRGYQCETAENGERALGLLGDEFFDAAVVDLKMPGMSGIEVVEALSRRHPEMRLIVLTGYGSIPTALEAVRRGADDYLTKPANADQVVAAIEGGDSDHAPVLEAPSLEKVEWEHIQRVLADCGGNVSRTAEVLGLHRRSLQRKLNRFAPNR